MNPHPRTALARTATIAALTTLTACTATPSQTGPLPTLTPLRDNVHLSLVITNPYLPLADVPYTVLESRTEKVIRQVLPDTRTIAGVECLILAEKEYEDGTLTEISYNYFAQDRLTNVYCFGEDVDEYENGKVTSHSGAWLVGSNTDEPALFMPAHPQIGFRFKRENAPPDAEEWDQIHATNTLLTVPAGTFKGVLVINESDDPDDLPGRWHEQKFYARTVGLISENESLSLTALSPPANPDTRTR